MEPVCGRLNSVNSPASPPAFHSADFKFNMTLLSFQRYLAGLVERDILEQDAGVYRLRK